MVLSLDLDADGKDEYMVCNFNDGMTPRCSIFSMLKDRWQRIGSVNLYSSDKSADRFKQIMRQGEIKPKLRVWNDLDLGDERVQIHYSIDEKWCFVHWVIIFVCQYVSFDYVHVGRFIISGL